MRQSFYEYCIAQGKESLLQEFDTEKNPNVTLSTLSHGSHQLLWWRCVRGHSWQAAVYTRTSGSGCPYCAGRLPWPGENDLASQRPDLAAQWAPENSVAPEQVTVGSHRKVWWVCRRVGGRGENTGGGDGLSLLCQPDGGAGGKRFSYDPPKADTGVG